MSTYKLNKANSAKVATPLDEKIKNLVKTKENIEKRNKQNKIFDPVTKEDLEKLNFTDDLAKLKAIQREKLLEDLSSLLNHKIRELEKKEKESKEKEHVLSELASALKEKIKQLENTNVKLQQEKKYSDELNTQLTQNYIKKTK